MTIFKTKLRIIPAYAGSTAGGFPRSSAIQDHPRIRGEHRRRHRLRRHCGGSSPHTRGALVTFRPLFNRERIIPAYAGSTPSPPRRRPYRRDHPRIRGEHRRRPTPSCRTRGSSPHTRGARHFEVIVDPIQRIIPAYAGSTSCAPKPTAKSRDHPRIRGEHFQTFMADIADRGSSPHTRGAPRS